MTTAQADLRTRIEGLAAAWPMDEATRAEAERAFQELVQALNAGLARAASPGEGGRWEVHTWVKQGILLGFRLGRLENYSNGAFPYFDKHTLPLRPLSEAGNVRLVPGGSSIRTGCYVAPGVVCMPPMFINIGAYVDEGTMVDSHALVGSCAQVGKRVHLSAAAQIGGVLEPIGSLPVVVEDDAFIGGNCGVYEGCIVRRGAVLAPGVLLTGSTRIYDLERERVLERTASAPLEVPEYAVVVPGSRRLGGRFAEAHGLAAYAPIIPKYRDGRTAAAVALEHVLR